MSACGYPYSECFQSSKIEAKDAEIARLHDAAAEMRERYSAKCQDNERMKAALEDAIRMAQEHHLTEAEQFLQESLQHKDPDSIRLTSVDSQYCWDHGENSAGKVGGVWLKSHCPECNPEHKDPDDSDQERDDA